MGLQNISLVSRAPLLGEIQHLVVNKALGLLNLIKYFVWHILKAKLSFTQALSIHIISVFKVIYKNMQIEETDLDAMKSFWNLKNML